MKRLLHIALALTLIFAFTALPAAAKTKIQVASWWSFESGSSLDALKNAFEAQNPEIEVEFVQIPSSEYYTKVLTMVAGGTPPDVAMLGMDKLGTWVPRGALQDLRPYMEKYSVNLDAFFPAVVDAIEIDGGIYAFPRDATTSVVAYNKKLFDEAGVPYPQPGWTREEFLETARALVQKDGSQTKVYGYAFDTFSDGFIDWLYLNGASVINPDGTGSGLHLPNAVEVLEFLQGMVVEGIAPAPALTSTFSNASGAFLSQRTAMYVTTVGWANSFANAEDLEWDVVPLPLWDEDSEPSTRLWVNYWTMPKGAKNADAAFQFLTFLISEEGQRIVGETRMGIPAIEELAYGPAFAGLEGKPEHKVYFLDVMEHAKPFPLFVQSDQFYAAMTREFDTMWSGERSVEEAVKALDQATKSLF
ncbi:MAG TPA: sugar ABC transporter substrate-binding protein [Firmicutes bacterium]|nr:MAG: hypothetical protein AA931_09960 [Peptococcaceae bacterium 1109]HHT73758.1 sugar ABC transporter substrate-binding protein [Bacillota bacterium]